MTKADRDSIRISVRWAKRKALRRVPGRIVGWEVEKEDGRVQYEFKIVARNGKLYEVEIDAITGKVVEAEPEAKAGESIRPKTAQILSKSDTFGLEKR